MHKGNRFKLKAEIGSHFSPVVLGPEVSDCWPGLGLAMNTLIRWREAACPRGSWLADGALSGELRGCILLGITPPLLA